MSTTSTRSSSFISPEVTSFFDQVEATFVMTLVSLSNILQMKMKGSVLTVKLDFGDGFVASTTITFEVEPVQLTFGSRSYPPSSAAAHVHHQRSNLFQMIQGKFARLVHSKCKRVATIVIQSWIGQHNATETHRVTPRVMPHPFLDSQNRSDDSDDDRASDGHRVARGDRVLADDDDDDEMSPEPLCLSQD